ncbi:hypothetical protein NDN01_02145 [Sphingomonas sp. QA11]|nr:hypothetical protein [Sphingomonas sp. QA11]WCM27756.1 hypothetical protein NDN01_02145 [Sphingomonas sp. QA11]
MPDRLGGAGGQLGNPSRDLVYLGPILAIGHVPFTELAPGRDASAQQEQVVMTIVPDDAQEGILNGLFRTFKNLKESARLACQDTGNLKDLVVAPGLLA